MNALKEKYAPEFDIVAIPNNQFGLEEPAKNEELLNCIRYVRPGNNYIPNFNLTIKYDVNGENQIELYSFLKGQCEGTRGKIANPKNLYWNPINRDDIIWNFEKFLIDHEGHVHTRYPPAVVPGQIEPIIEYLLAKMRKSRGVTSQNQRRKRRAIDFL